VTAEHLIHEYLTNYNRIYLLKLLDVFECIFTYFSNGSYILYYLTVLKTT